MYVHACIHTYLHTYVHTYIHTYLHTYMYVYTYVYRCIHNIYNHSRIYIMHVMTPVCVYIYTCILCTHYMCVHIYVYIHVQRLFVYTHSTPSLVSSPRCGFAFEALTPEPRFSFLGVLLGVLGFVGNFADFSQPGKYQNIGRFKKLVGPIMDCGAVLHPQRSWVEPMSCLNPRPSRRAPLRNGRVRTAKAYQGAYRSVWGLSLFICLKGPKYLIIGN